MNEAKLIAVTKDGEIEVTSGSQVDILAQVTPDALGRWASVNIFLEGELLGSATNPAYDLLRLLR